MIARILMLVAVAVSGCGGPASTYKPSGKPSMALEIRRASTQPVDGWKEYETDQAGHRTIYVSPDGVLTNSDLASTGVERDDNGLWALAVRLKEPAARRFATLTGEIAAARAAGSSTPAELLAVFIDGELISSPVVFDRIANGTFNLMGAFSHEESEQEARRFARGLVQSE